MGRTRIKLPILCIGRAMGGKRVRSASFKSKPTSSSIKYVQKTEFPSNVKDEFSSDKPNDGTETGNKIMIVVDASVEAKGALEWALAHTVQSQDTIVLVHVAKPLGLGMESNAKLNLKAYGLLHNMKNVCQAKKPGAQVEVQMLEGKEKGPLIVQEAKQQMVSLLVIGQRKQSMLWWLMKRWVGKRTAIGVAEFCIQNASCMTIAVRRKNRKLGGYLITTKRHKNFWLLA
ncbi:putative Adenine nucleotide alpha hydrolases-like superfamily protein [Quillaja saponaria]|uniref:Adenine nucleotide alpha hydrolases-like superfamily protein n=1 Tax=Quillaja saponaria TaxID=32244 RepID=A0AAD7PIT9_QUISA|nr:putative Adenine nucleotide alpha hydrolases-like superfamily protein [Quillaja saponaria]